MSQDVGSRGVQYQPIRVNAISWLRMVLLGCVIICPYLCVAAGDAYQSMQCLLPMLMRCHIQVSDLSYKEKMIFLQGCGEFSEWLHFFDLLSQKRIQLLAHDMRMEAGGRFNKVCVKMHGQVEGIAS